MKIDIISTAIFDKNLNKLLKNGQLLKEDYEEFLKNLAQKPELGKIIIGTHGARKIRLKSAGKGKSGGFRICYYYIIDKCIFLMLIYAKNEQENISNEERKSLKQTIEIIKRGLKQ